jgi:hypothetical protein
MYDYDEPYYEPTEADEIFFEAREKLINSLKGTVKQYVENVKLENEQLKQDLEKMRKQVQDVKNKERILEREKSDLMNTVRKERLSELLKDFEVERFMVTTARMLAQKCDKCDDDRILHYKTPLGKDQKERCDCYEDSVNINKPKSMLCTEFKVDSHNGNKLRMWYKRNIYDKEDYYDSSAYLKECYNEQPYESLDKYNIFFDTEEECELYCDWLNRDIDLVKYNYDLSTEIISKKKGE